MFTVEMVGMPGMNSYLLQNLNQILASGMGGPLAGMLGQLAQLPTWGPGKPPMWQPEKVLSNFFVLYKSVNQHLQPVGLLTDTS
jgi:hypothetical protein